MTTKSQREAAAKAARKLLQGMIDASPRGDRAWLTVARALASDEAAPVWHVLGGDPDAVRRVANMARQSFEQAAQEIARPQQETHERGDIRGVIGKLKALRTAIKMSSLPGNRATVGVHWLDACDMPPVDLEFGWHSLPIGGTGFGYPLAVCDVLEWAEQMAREHLQRLPPRARPRRSKQPEQVEQVEQVERAIFVRYLAWHFRHKFGKELRGTLALIAQAVYNPANAVTKDTVKGFLKDTPPAFLRGT